MSDWRRLFIFLPFLSMILVATPVANAAKPQRQPNLIIIFCDDLGYGDLGCYGAPAIRTPNLDQMAAEGQRWTQFYVAASVCTPSRAGLMTGRYPIRSGMCSSKRRVLFPDSLGGLPDSELTIAEVLKNAGYATAAIGKWHLGHLPQYLPTQHGFDSYFGIPYSNDMDRQGKGDYRKVTSDPSTYGAIFNVPLMRDEQIVERPADQFTLTRRYTQAATEFITSHQKQPFFLYLAHNMPHVPLFANREFLGQSQRGLYGDVVEELDWSVGRILSTLRQLKLDKHTLVVFTSDNGPWLWFEENGGSAGELRGGKGYSFEGGIREPCIFWWPGQIQPEVVMGMGATLDLLPTFAHLAGAKLPADLLLDGVDLSATLTKGEPSPRHAMIHYHGSEIYAVREGAWKAHFGIREPAYGKDAKNQKLDTPLLFNIHHDPAERFDRAAEHPEIIERLKKIVAEHQATVTPVDDQLSRR